MSFESEESMLPTRVSSQELGDHPQAGTGKYTVTKVEVKNLGQQDNDETLVTNFQAFGKVLGASVSKDPNAESPKGTVMFGEMSAAKAAVQALDGREVNGQTWRVALAVDQSPSPSDGSLQASKSTCSINSNLFVKGLGPDMTLDMLREIFGQHGTIVQLKILCRQQKKGTAGEALVRMTNVEEAEVAIQCVNNTQPPGAVEKLTVRFAETLQEKIKRKQQESFRQGVSRALPRPPDSSERSNHQLLQHTLNFDPNARTMNAPMPHPGYMMDQAPNAAYMAQRQQLHAAHNQQAAFLSQQSTAYQQFHGVPSVPVPPAMVAMFEQMWGMQHQQQQQQQQSAQYQDQSNLYVNELPPNADELLLYKIFAPFGAIISTRVIPSKQKDSNGFGFVKFVHQHDAHQAIQAINGMHIQGSTLEVSLKTPSPQAQNRGHGNNSNRV